ncbi:MAG: hypothetical protein KIT79_06640 [Deltaproteobacteria bacterium]|nr:hypothetical protein [Deltaproteobacteria bacterium]
MKRILIAAIAATITTITGCGSSGGGAGNADLYLIDGASGTQGFIYSVDLSTDPITVEITGQVTSDDGDVLPMTGLAFGPGGVVAGTTSAAEEADDLGDLLVEIDLATGDAEAIDWSGDTDCIDGVNDLAFAGDTLYAVSGGATCIMTIDEDGEVAETDTSNYGALAYDAAGETLYYFNSYDIDGASLDTIDLDDGSIVTGDVEVDAGDPLGDYPDIEYSYIKGATFVGSRLIALVGYYYGTSVLVEVDPEDGTIVVLGIVPPNADAIAAAN